MELSTKLCISLCVFAPAFIYFLIAVSRSPETKAHAGFIKQSEMIYKSQSFPPEARKKAAALADNPQLVRGLPR
ncbi:hypothetical protein GCK32_007165 [Trichostrongylus colubriformis]|uniref:Uncharacterized protein n=1 Tax=Trichostrongylus colubriformis TaxID=6319 RepID=A0AAN8FRP3_TRICO